MRACYLLVLLGLSVCGVVVFLRTRPHSDEGRPAVRGQEALRLDEREVRHNLKTQAEAMGKAMANDDHQALVDLTYPRVVRLAGGRTRMILTLQETALKIGAVWPVRSVRIHEPTGPASSAGELFAVVPFTLELKGPQERRTLEGYLVGVSGDRGATWKFLDCSGADRDAVKDKLPQFPDALALPERHEAVVEPVE
jgi:hypothetical protein